SVGAAWQKADVILFAESQSGASADITLNDLDIDESDSTFYFDYRYRFKERWALAAGAYAFSASGGHALERDLSYNGVDFAVGTMTEARLEADAYIVDLLYNAYESPSLNLWVGGGVHALDLGASISGEVSVNENESSFEVADDTLLAPVPNFRGVGIWTLNQRLALALKAGWLSANVDNYSGDFIYAHLRAVYSVTDNIGLSLGYQYTEIDIVEERERGDLGFDVVLQGPTITLGFSF
ncbi:MAG: hypothetical protein AAF933_15560, partial [Pseudomonadota bacterium]